MKLSKKPLSQISVVMMAAVLADSAIPLSLYLLPPLPRIINTLTTSKAGFLRMTNRGNVTLFFFLPSKSMSRAAIMGLLCYCMIL